MAASSNLFPDEHEARLRKTHVFPKATFRLYESEALAAAGLASQFQRPERSTLPFQRLAQPVFLPRPFAINDVQSLAVRLALIQYYRQRGWTLGMTDAELGATCLTPNGEQSKYARGFIIGDGTGVGKTREIAAFVVSAIMAERTVQQAGFRHHTDENTSSLWSRQPLFVWLTCSETLFDSCKEELRAVLFNSDTSPEGSWVPAGFPDAPSSYDSSVGITTVDHDGEELFIKFANLKRMKEDMALSNGLVSVPTILFMTYAGLTINLEETLSLLIGGGRPIMESNGSFTAPIITAILCDEFHKPKAISDAYRRELAKGWEREDRAVLGIDDENSTTSLADIVWRFCCAMKATQASKRRLKRPRANEPHASNSNTKKVVSAFLSDLGQADSFRLLIELTKRHTFYLMASATPFQSNEDLHSIDHLIRNLLPAYTSLDAFNCHAEPYAGIDLVENREYTTQFLEDLVKLLYNQGQLVSRAISMDHVECAVIRCPMSPMHTQAVDGLASYMAETKLALKISEELRRHLTLIIENLAAEQIRKGWSNSQFRTELDGAVERVNRVGSTTTGPLSRLAPFFRAVVVDDPGLWCAGSDVSESIVPEKATELIFQGKHYTQMANQFAVNLAGMSVFVCKATLLTLKAKAVIDSVGRLRKSPELFKVVVAMEQTGDAFLTHLIERMCDGIIESCHDEKKKKLMKLCEFDASPIANAVLSVYRLLSLGVAIRSAVRVLPLAATHTCVLLVPRLPPVWPLMATGGNFLDVVEQHVGDWRHSEITNRKFQSRWSKNGMLTVSANTKSTNALKSIDVFNNTNRVDVMILGPRGNTGFSLHDSHANAVTARRIHFIVDPPYNPIAFRQCVGRTHRNGQVSTPAFLVFSTNAASERRFYDCLQWKVKDLIAGSFGDRYSKNTLDVAAAETLAEVSDVSAMQDTESRAVVDREQFLDHGLSLKVIGHIIKIIVSDISPLSLFSTLGQMGVYESKRFVFIEGLDSENGLFIETLILGLGVASRVLNEERDLLASTLRTKTLVGIMRAAGRVLDSNLVESLICDPGVDRKSQKDRLFRLKTAATRLFAAAAKSNNDSMRTELLNGTDSGHLRLPRPGPHAVKSKPAGPRVVTARVLGAGTISDEVMAKLPLVAAICVLSTLTVECPSLILRTLKAATPHACSGGDPTSFVLSIARRLAVGGLDSRQFYNHYFSPMVDSTLLKDLFSVVRHIMARDARLDALRDTRVNPFVAARYTSIHEAPKSTTNRRHLLPANLAPHLTADLYLEDTNEAITPVEDESQSPYRVDAQLTDGTTVTLTPENSIFINCYLDYFILKNIVGCEECVTLLQFENHQKMQLPPIALFQQTKFFALDNSEGERTPWNTKRKISSPSTSMPMKRRRPPT